MLRVECHSLGLQGHVMCRKEEEGQCEPPFPPVRVEEPSCCMTILPQIVYSGKFVGKALFEVTESSFHE